MNAFECGRRARKGHICEDSCAYGSYSSKDLKTAFHDRVCMIHRSYQAIVLFLVLSSGLFWSTVILIALPVYHLHDLSM